MAKISPMLLVAVVIVVALVMAPQLMGGFGDIIGRGWDTWRDLFNGTGDGMNGNGDNGLSGSSGLGLTVYYEDGTEKTFDVPKQTPLLPLAISDGGGAVSHIEIFLKVYLQYEGTLQSWNAEALVNVAIKKGTSTKVGQFRSWVIEENGNSWGTEAKQIGRKTIAAGEIESATLAHGVGNYNLAFIFDLTMQVKFTDGTTDVDGASDVTTWNYEYAVQGEPPVEQSSIKSLKVTISVNALH